MFDRINKGMWWDKALTLVDGCAPVSPGCDNCWAASMDKRFGKSTVSPETGKYFGKIVCREDHIEIPLRAKNPTVWAVWNDLFHKDVPLVFQISTMVMMREATRHIFIILTKRPERMKYFFDLLYRDGFAVKEPLVNVWLGVTAENQEQADKRIPILLEIPAAVRFVSVEPMIGPVSLAGFDGKIYRPWLDTIAWTKAIDWIICGCESGLRRRKTEWAWIRSLQEQCESAKVPFFLKQGELGGKVVKAPYDQYLQLPSSIAPRKETRNIWHESDPSSN